MKKKIIMGLLALSSALVFSANAATVELALVLDESGSISAANWTLQKNAYINALNDASVLALDGSVAIGVWKFDDTVEQVFAMTTMSSAAQLAALTAALNGMVQGAGATAIGDAITAAKNGILAHGNNFDKQVIDVSTDGVNNTGSDPITARNLALAAGVDQVNGLGIGGAANLSFVGGTGSFGVQVANFQDFEDALKRKIQRETGRAPDAGGTLALSLLGLMSLAAARRMRIA